MKHNYQKMQHLEEQRLIAASVELADGTFKTDFVVPGMRCSACISSLEKGLRKSLPLIDVRANLSLKTVSVIWSQGQTDPIKIAEQLDELGFENHVAESDTSSAEDQLENKRLLTALAVAGFAAANIMLLSVSVWSGADEATAQLFHLISGVIAVPAVAIAGQPFFRSALRVLSARRLNMDVPISLAVLLALLMSLYEGHVGGSEAYFDASVMSLFFLLIGRYLDMLMRQKARSAVERIASLSAKSGALVSTDGSISDISLEEIREGMILRVFPGERLPVDGTVVAGKSYLDRSHVTGESEPITASLDDTIEAGTLNLTSVIDITASSDARSSFLGEMQRMISEAEQGRSNYIRVADRMAAIYAPAVHLLALIAFIGWMFVTGGDWHTSIYTAIAVLIVTCPCALGLAVPVAHVIAANRLMQEGVMMRDGTGLERLAETDAVFFDKTGTLTSGTPIVSGSFGQWEKSVSFIRSLAATSRHPAATAVDQFLSEYQTVDITGTSEIPGNGIEAFVDGRRMRLGRTEWVSEITKETKHSMVEHSVSFAVENEALVHFDTDDTLRDGAVEAVAALAKSGLGIEMLSGDLESRVKDIANRCGIEVYHARQTPADKIAHLESTSHDGQKVLMVGDGINDGPALAAAHVSMAPASASDVGRQASDFVFTRNSLKAAPFAFATARKTQEIVRQNFGLAIAYNCIAVPLAMAGYVTPLIAAIAMSASSIVVVANSFRIHFMGRETEPAKSADNPADLTMQPAVEAA